MPDFVTNTDWIKPGAEVVIQVRGRRPPRAIRTTVARVAAKSFTVVGETLRFKLETLSTATQGSNWDPWRIVALHPESQEARRALEDAAVNGLQSAAIKAVNLWDRYGEPRDVSKIDAAILALTRYRDALRKHAEEWS